VETIDGWGIASFVALAVVLFVVAQHDFVVAWLLQKILEPGVRWFQRVFLGIDKLRAGPEAMIGCSAAAVEFHQGEEGQYVGSVRVDGETWQASSNRQILAGAVVRVVRREGLILFVEATEDH
jgi:membrane-bound ClpP family serine protease